MPAARQVARRLAIARRWPTFRRSAARRADPFRTDLAYDPSNVFARILRREIPAHLLHEDEHCVAFRDVAPQAPLHVLVIPRQALAGLGDAGADDAALLGHLLAHVINTISFGWSLADVAVPTAAVVEALGLATGAALVAGLPPAWRYARMRPATALREG